MQNQQEQNQAILELKPHPQVPGLFICQSFLSKSQQQTLLQILNNNSWQQVVARRSQQFGRYYNQYKKAMDKRRTIPFPPYITFIQDRLKQLKLFDQDIDWLQTSWLIQQYSTGQGIHPHIDQYGEGVIGINLAAETDMLFSRAEEEIRVPLKRRGLYLMTGESRYQWKHGIVDVWKRRVSITVRNTVFNENMRKK